MRRTNLAAAAIHTARPIFQSADWLWSPIPDSPVLDADSAAMSAALSAFGTEHGCALVDFGVTMNGPAGIDGNTPAYDIEFIEDTGRGGSYAPDPFFLDMPIPNGVLLATGSDIHMVTADPSTNLVYGLWQAEHVGNWGATWGGITDFNGDGIDYAGSSTGSQLSRYAGVIRVSEIAAGVIPHALFFSTDIAQLTNFRYPAVKTDGANFAGGATTIPEGARVQLDPSIDLTVIPGITPGELAVGTALQTYGAYCGDNGGVRMAFLFELASDAFTAAPGAVYAAAGLEWDYFDMSHIPWNGLRVLAEWDGS